MFKKNQMFSGPRMKIIITNYFNKNLNKFHEVVFDHEVKKWVLFCFDIRYRTYLGRSLPYVVRYRYRYVYR